MATSANDALLASWRLSLHSLQPRTIRLYMEEARRFADWLAASGRPARVPGDLLTVGRQDVEGWIHDLQAAGLAKATIRSRWIALRNLYGWMVEEDEIDVSPLAKVNVAKADSPPPDVLDDTTLRALFKACEGRSFEDRRDTALIRFMLATGLRVSETCSLMLADVDLVARLVTVRGKGDKVRVVRFDAATAAALDRYRRVRGRHPRYAQRPELWIGFRGPLTRKGVPLILDKRAAMAGVDHIHPHQLRHSWADRWLSNGGTEGDLQLLGGWANADVMRRYGSARATDRALKAYDNVNPLGDL